MSVVCRYFFVFFFLCMLRDPRSTLFPYTTLFRSWQLLVFGSHRAFSRGAVGGRLNCLSRCVGTLRERQFSRSEEHTSELQSRFDLVCRLLLEKKNIRRTPELQRDHEGK